MTFGTGESLDTIMKRAKLPIAVTFLEHSGMFLLGTPALAAMGKRPKYSAALTPHEASRLYFALCASLSTSADAPPSSAGQAAADPVPVSPMGAL